MRGSVSTKRCRRSRGCFAPDHDFARRSSSASDQRAAARQLGAPPTREAGAARAPRAPSPWNSSTSSARSSGPASARQALRREVARHGEQLARGADEALVAPHRRGAALDDAHFEHVRPALAHVARSRPTAATRPRARTRSRSTAKKPASSCGRDRRAQLLGVDALELGLDLEPAERPAVGREPAVHDADDRQRDQRERRRSSAASLSAKPLMRCALRARSWSRGCATQRRRTRCRPRARPSARANGWSCPAWC